MKEMLNRISPKFIRSIALPAVLSLSVLFVLFTYRYPNRINNESVFMVLVLCEMLVMALVSYSIHEIIKDDTVPHNVHNMMSADMSKDGPISNAISDGIIVVDKKGNIKNINQGLCGILGVQEDKILGANIFNIYKNWSSSDENKLLLEVLVESMEAQREFRQVERVYTRNEEQLYISVSTYLLRNKYKRIIGVIAFLHDHTHERRLEQYLLRAEKLVNAGQMAAELAHEIKNPICSIKGLLQIMGKKHSLEESKYYEVITSEIDRISNMLQRFLTLTQDTPKREKISMNNLIEGVVPILESCAETKSIELSVDMQKQIPCIAADAENIKQVILNIVQNGIDALSVKGKMKISIWYDQLRDMLKMEFKDNGSGIKAEHLDKIFDPFFTTKENGSGLGLAISHKIVENHGGKLFAFNNQDGGATFVIELPADRQVTIQDSRIS